MKTRAALKANALRWLKPLGFTLVLVGLVATAIGADWQFSLAALAISAVAFGFFYLAIPGGTHFGVTVANFLALYVCTFVIFHDANFTEASPAASVVALFLPVATFLGACFIRRRTIATRLRARRLRELEHLPRLTRWVPFVLAVGALSFAWPEFHPSPRAQDALLIGSMAAIALVVALAVRDVVLLTMDIALVFEGVAARLDRLVRPVMAFLTVYSLIVVVFGCLYRIAELTTRVAQFTQHGEPHVLDFADSMWFSMVTIATVGYGDLAPAGPLVRLLAGAEMVAGVLLLLFGFSEIMRHGGPDASRRPHLPGLGARPQHTRLLQDIESRRHDDDET